VDINAIPVLIGMNAAATDDLLTLRDLRTRAVQGANKGKRFNGTT